MATCKECFHYEACEDMLATLGYIVDGDGKDADTRCKEFKHKDDIAEVVRCEKCKSGEPYERTDGKTGYYCLCPRNSFVYGQRLDRVFNPVKTATDYCSYGERRDHATD